MFSGFINIQSYYITEANLDCHRTAATFPKCADPSWALLQDYRTELLLLPVRHGLHSTAANYP